IRPGYRNTSWLARRVCRTARFGIGNTTSASRFSVRRSSWPAASASAWTSWRRLMARPRSASGATELGPVGLLPSRWHTGRTAARPLLPGKEGGEARRSVGSLFKIGDRVRLSDARRNPAYRTGDVATVVNLMPSWRDDDHDLYQVRMDNGRAAFYPVFYGNELEKVT